MRRLKTVSIQERIALCAGIALVCAAAVSASMAIAYQAGVELVMSVSL